MANYSYVAIDPHGLETRGRLEVQDQEEALRRIKEMGLYATRLLQEPAPKPRTARPSSKAGLVRRDISLGVPGLGGGVPARTLSVFTRQLATLVDAGMPLLRGLRTLREQEENAAMKRVLEGIAQAIESGSSFSEAVVSHPKVFNRLYVNMVKAGEIGGALEVTLRRLAEFLEKSARIKGKIMAALLYPCAVLSVAAAILTVMMVFVVPRFKTVYEGLMNGLAMPAFTLLVLKVSEVLRSHFAWAALGLGGVGVLFTLALRTQWGRWSFDRLKLALPLLGPVFRKAAISRFSRTLGTLVSSGVPILQALTIVKETSGNVVLGRLVGTLHDHVKEGDPLAPTLRASRVFPVMVAGMVDIGEQTGALPEMLMRVADTYDEEVDNAVNAMTSLLEPVMIVFLAVVVGCIVIAMFLPLVRIMEVGFDTPKGDASEN
jgi:type IV pilus assembly protein PilC